MLYESKYDWIWGLGSDDEEDDYYDHYPYDEEWSGTYHNRFPSEWRNTHKQDETGPEHCGNCACYGCIDNVFVGYCGNCSQHVYEGKRGRGFDDIGKERDDEWALNFDSCFETYLKDVVFEKTKEQTVEELQYEIDDEDIYGPHEPQDPSNESVLNCHFEGGYNDY